MAYDSLPSVFYGAVIGAIPGVIFTLLRFDSAGWANLLAVAVGSVLGAFVGHWLATRHPVHRPTQHA